MWSGDEVELLLALEVELLQGCTWVLSRLFVCSVVCSARVHHAHCIPGPLHEGILIKQSEIKLQTHYQMRNY